MKYLSEYGTWIVGGIGSMYVFVTGQVDQSFFILLLCMLIDIISGLMKGALQNRLRSAIMSMGIIKKGAILLSVAFGYVLDIAVNGGQPVFSIMMTWLAIGNEGLSVVENLTAMGVKIPSVITDKLGQYSDTAKELRKEKDGEK